MYLHVSVILRGNNDYFSKQEAIIGVYNVHYVLCEVGKQFWYIIKAVPWLGWFVAALSLYRLQSNLRPLHVGFVVERVALGYDFLLSTINIFYPSKCDCINTAWWCSL